MTTISSLDASPAGSRPPLDADALLDLPAARLDALFRNSPPGRMPRGETRGTLIMLPGTPLARPAARVVGVFVWRGKRFRRFARQLESLGGRRVGGDLKNLVGPFRLPAVRAEVYEADSWLDGRPCIVIDYSRSSLVASWIRDEIREIAPGLYLGLVWGKGRVFGGRRLLMRFALARQADAVSDGRARERLRALRSRVGVRAAGRQ